MSGTGPEPTLGTDPWDVEHADAAAPLGLPPALAALFGPRFTRSHALYDEFIYRLAVRVFLDSGLAAAVAEWGSVHEVVARAGLDPRPSTIPVDWMLRHITARGAVEVKQGPAGPRFRARQALTPLDPAPVLAEQRQHDPASLPSFALAEAAARDYPAFLRGERSGEEILLAPARLPLWTGYFSNENLLYAVNNAVGAVAVDMWMPPGPGVILELGGGLASGSVALLDRLAAAGRLNDLQAYRFTELVPAFLRRGERLLRERFADAPFRFERVDMNRGLAEQGVEPESVSIVYAVNTLHVAHDLAFTLGEIRRVLVPGGQLIVSECIRTSAGQTIYPEFVFNLLETFRAPRLQLPYRPNGGFLAPEQWADALGAAGFTDVRMIPDIPRIKEWFPTFFSAAFGARRPA